MRFFIYHLFTKKPVDVKKSFMQVSGEICFFDKSRLICSEQLMQALYRVERVWKKGYNISKLWGIEVLLELGGSMQIAKVLPQFEIKEDTECIIIISRGAKYYFDGLQEGLPEIKAEAISQFNLKRDPCAEILVKGNMGRYL